MKTTLIAIVIALTLTACTGQGDLTKEQFDKVEIGMTQEEVFEIIGEGGDIVSEAEGIKMYQYHGTSVGGNANFMFDRGKLVNKAQAGLK